ncbi:MAG: acetyl-CoA carboxylase carboxyltransferase subunit alpha [Candidatus Acidulodesulfobacterium ferriphilum]|uniref:Acetyl-coenzyme A carboxylase carboxyl transferase subunit alpha n=1 Tax=Candidatus Acidulodesulfobacterium ferriphilum TaxID=2597223 RepID=A0A519BB03_9DELT|nr:MAG: acetyl-CoA carboxylase carboxyltransferase subunit alpha [Candidatus Acidulodesulfobacterium ferriphilum]
MALQYLDFEKPIIELDQKIEELKTFNLSGITNVDDEIKNLESKRDKLIKDIFKNIGNWQITQLSRHPLRPYTLDYIELITENFTELHGDRLFMDDKAVVGGFCFIKSNNNGGYRQRVLIVGHQKGRNTKDKMCRNFGMPHPEGYRKAQRLFRLAEKYSIPIITLIDTPGAYPGLGAEERGQSEAIAKTIYTLLNVKVPVLSIIIGEGGSGGALAFGVGNKVLMLEYSVYSVISPEGCASILYKDVSKTEEASNSLKLTAKDLHGLKVIDGIIPEPLGGAHKNKILASNNIRKAIIENLDHLKKYDGETLRNDRIRKFTEY